MKGLRGRSPLALAIVTLLAILATSVLGGSPVAALAAASAEDDPVPVILIGAPGLTFSDLDAEHSPTLVDLAQRGATASMTVRAVRTRSCAVDGWLTLSAGRRAADLPGPCREPIVAPDGSLAFVDDYQRAAADDSYGAVPGTLGQRFADVGHCLAPIGAGGQVAAADPQGRVREVTTPTGASTPCPVLIVDAGTLSADSVARAGALAGLDALVAGFVDDYPDADVIVAGVGDGDSTMSPRALIAAGPNFPPGTLTSPSTRQPGLVQLQDLTATLLARVGADTGDLTGRPISVIPETGGADRRVADRTAFEVRAITVRGLAPQITASLAGLFAAWAAFVGWLVWRRRPVPRSALVAGIAVATIPIATVLVNNLLWWGTNVTPASYLTALVLTVGVLTTVATVMRRPRPLDALDYLATVTALTLTVDVLLGSQLQLIAPFAQNPIVGGRFYGFGNASFALYGVAVLALVYAMATRAPARWRTIGAVALLGVALAIEAAPSLGADFGGPPGLLLGGLVVIAGATGARVSRGRAVLALVAATVLAVIVAVVDWLRPEGERTHVGSFVETVLQGEAAAVIARKLSQNLTNFGSPPLLLIAVASVALVVVVIRRLQPTPAIAVMAQGSAVLAAVGFFLNDSGLVIPVFVSVVLLPLLAADPGWRTRPAKNGSVAVAGGLDELDENAARVLGVDEVDS
ncbi:MAG: hypothetical protein KBB39_03270 [Phycicoccus sp.]|nr:hypothetical protein [Phycicoccus sp.]